MSSSQAASRLQRQYSLPPSASRVSFPSTSRTRLRGFDRTRATFPPVTSTASVPSETGKD